MPVIVSTQVYRNQIAAIFQQGGEGYRWLDLVKLAMFTASVANAPVRSTVLQNSHESEIRGLNQYSCIATIYNTAEHAEWVHGGTLDKAPIFPNDGPFMYIPAGNGYGRKKLRSVAGQKANPWIDEACTAIAMGYGAFPVG